MAGCGEAGNHILLPGSQTGKLAADKGASHAGPRAVYQLAIDAWQHLRIIVKNLHTVTFLEISTMHLRQMCTHTNCKGHLLPQNPHQIAKWVKRTIYMFQKHTRLCTCEAGSAWRSVYYLGILTERVNLNVQNSIGSDVFSSCRNVLEKHNVVLVK